MTCGPSLLSDRVGGTAKRAGISLPGSQLGPLLRSGGLRLTGCSLSWQHELAWSWGREWPSWQGQHTSALQGQLCLKDRGQPCVGALEVPGATLGARVPGSAPNLLLPRCGQEQVSAFLAFTFYPKVSMCDSGAQKVPSHLDVILLFIKPPALENKGGPQDLRLMGLGVASCLCSERQSRGPLLDSPFSPPSSPG